MKKIVVLLISFLSVMTSCEIDNYDGPDASIHGSILDAQTGELIGTDIQECSLTAVEQGFDTPENQTWKIKNTGEYRNDMIFSATYNISFRNGNCYSFEEPNVVIKRGDNQIDFKTTPYIRIKNSNITKNGNIVTATFSVEGGKEEVKLASLQLFAFSDMWVGNSIRFALTSGTDVQRFESPIDIDASKTYTLTIDLEKDASYFKYGNKNYFFRIGALASVSGQGTIRHNYSPLVTIPF